MPAWAMRGGIWSVTRTSDELSIICAEVATPPNALCERGWRVLKLEGPFEFGLTGILDSVLRPLAEARISIFAISTYDTDYVLIKEARLEDAITVLQAAGHQITTHP
jgi:uncharacterized protein